MSDIQLRLTMSKDAWQDLHDLLRAHAGLLDNLASPDARRCRENLRKILTQVIEQKDVKRLPCGHTNPEQCDIMCAHIKPYIQAKP